MRRTWPLVRQLIRSWILCWAVICISSSVVFADLYINILAVNGTEEQKEKEIQNYLPSELGAEDILDTAGLTLDYDVNRGAYFVTGKVALGPKETKTFKVRIKDIWQIDQVEIQEIKKNIDISVTRMENTEFQDISKIRRQSLLQRIDFITNQQEEFADNIEKRIDRFKAYSDELLDIREKSVSVNYWKSKPPSKEDSKIINLVVDLENPSQEEKKTVNPKHFLPEEVKPEHLVELQSFELGYDGDRGQSFLQKEELLDPGEKKQYKIGIYDVWNVDQSKLENLKDRTREAYDLLVKSQYKDSADFLVKSIKTNIERIEASQTIERDIKEHISAYRVNDRRYRKAEADVDALEDLLAAIRADLERSILKNVLQKIRSLKGIAEIAKSLFKKPNLSTAWKIITGIVIFVGFITFVHFIIWGRRSKDVKIEEKKKEDEEKKE